MNPIALRLIVLGVLLLLFEIFSIVRNKKMPGIVFSFLGLTAIANPRLPSVIFLSDKLRRFGLFLRTRQQVERKRKRQDQRQPDPGLQGKEQFIFQHKIEFLGPGP